MLVITWIPYICRMISLLWVFGHHFAYFLGGLGRLKIEGSGCRAWVCFIGPLSLGSGFRAMGLQGFGAWGLGLGASFVFGVPLGLGIWGFGSLRPP